MPHDAATTFVWLEADNAMIEPILNIPTLEVNDQVRHPEIGMLCELIALAFFESDATPAVVAREHNSTRLWVWAADGTGSPTTGLKPPQAKVVLTPGDLALHVKSQGVYSILFWATSVNPETAVVVYQSLDDKRIWVREHAYMFDGRFERLPAEITV